MRLGIIGCGWAGALRSAAIAKIPAFRAVAVADQDFARARALSDSYGSQAVSDWRALVSRDDLDAVVVSTPPHLHAQMCIGALEQGKHVLCEKPLARNPTECREIVRAAERTGRVLAVGFNYRFYPAIVKAREILDSGRIGELSYIKSFAGHPGGNEFTHPWVHDVEVMGGGTLLDNGIHIIDLTHYFLGDVVEVKGYATGGVWGFAGCEDNGFALLKSSTGKVASLQASWSEWWGYRFVIEIYGTQGCVRASYPPMMAQVIWFDKPGGRTRRRVHLFPIFQVIERLRSPRWTALQSFVEDLKAFAQATAGNPTPLALGRDGLRAVQIAHAIYESSRNGHHVRLEHWATPHRCSV